MKFILLSFRMKRNISNLVCKGTGIKYFMIVAIRFLKMHSPWSCAVSDNFSSSVEHLFQSLLHTGSTYNIPICIWLLDNHPLSSPMVYVKPTPDMLIKASRHVDQNGKVYLPYLHEWNPVRHSSFHVPSHFRICNSLFWTEFNQFNFGLDYNLYLCIFLRMNADWFDCYSLNYWSILMKLEITHCGCICGFLYLEIWTQIFSVVSPWTAVHAFHTSNSFYFLQNSSDLPGLIQIMIMTFSEMPPVYSKPKTAQPPGATPYPLPYPTNSPGKC